MIKYEVTQVRLQGVPKIPYADGVGKHRGVCAHATANYGDVGGKPTASEDTAMGERNYEQNNWNQAFVHYFADYKMILDVADNDYISYGCGSGNKYFINIELCQTRDPQRFIESYNRWIFIMACVLYENKLGVIDGETLVSHDWVSKNMGGTHTDPIAYLKTHGKTWSDVVQDVTRVYNELEDEDMAKLDPYVASQVVSIIQWYHRRMEGNADVQSFAHYLANEVRKAAGLPLENE